MSSTENKRKELEHILNKENFVKITEAIKVLRDESPFPGAIGLLISYYNKSDNDSVKRLISDFMNDLKVQTSSDEVVAELRKDLKTETKRMIISSCWQSGLDYSEYSADFTKIFLSSDYMTAVECFSVIESSAETIERIKKDELISIIEKAAEDGMGEKEALAMELITVLRQDDGY